MAPETQSTCSLGPGRPGCREEYEHMIRVLGSDAEVWKTLQHQFAVIYSRTQVIFTLGALAITVSGFSGHRIVAAGPLSGVPLVIGIIIVLSALVYAIIGLGRLRWISTFTGPDTRDSFCRIIGARNTKSRHFRRCLMGLIFGLGFYVLALCNYLIQASFGEMVLL